MKRPSQQLIQALACSIFLAASVPAFAEEPPQLPDAAKKLEQSYNQAIQAAVKPIRTRYLEELRKLQEQSMKSGNLKDAVALKWAIDTVEAEHLFGKWRSNGGVVEIREDHTAIWSGGINTATWEVQGNEIIISWKNPKAIYTYSISDRGDTISGKQIEGGKTNSIAAIRMR